MVNDNHAWQALDKQKDQEVIVLNTQNVEREKFG